ncbi:hypothetical protein N8I77_007406 [Diaporthe amygdali]|uniref:NADP-dependent oxidoreductase domain-containing protein n=1 Tax=Phomopsis amygdali TaxID=1214568 RepID=A0AAD9W1V8_PHOAM|nr:hypothetical protein N8I77_007406 [Diaporthe amygdali]
MAPSTHFTLNTGAKIRAIGLGTWQSKPGEVRKAVAYALRDGYRHIDAALIYGNENEVGQGIKDSGVPREEIFLTSKLWNTHQANVKEGLQKTLDALGVEYLDLYLIHWPVRLVPNESSELLPVNPDGTRSVDRSWDQGETWRQMEEVYKSGKVKAIGVANWSIPYLEKLRAPIMSDPDIQKIADKNGVSAATILISYHVNKGAVVLPKSVTEERISSNKEVISLSQEDLAVLDSLAANGKAKRINTPLWGFDLGFSDWYGPVKS